MRIFFPFLVGRMGEREKLFVTALSNRIISLQLWPSTHKYRYFKPHRVLYMESMHKNNNDVTCKKYAQEFYYTDTKPFDVQS